MKLFDSPMVRLGEMCLSVRPSLSDEGDCSSRKEKNRPSDLSKYVCMGVAYT